jgi:hypothetical protein
LAKETEAWESVPPVVSVPEGRPPSDAHVLFDGGSLDAWESVKRGAARWEISDGALTVVPGAGDIRTKGTFGDVQLHLEWRSPEKIVGEDGEPLMGQARGNSGVFLQDRYEIQILDSYENPTYANGQAGAVYRQHIPLVNVSRPPGEWQTLDITYTAPRFNSKGALLHPAYVTALHNGVLIQNHVEIKGSTKASGRPFYEAHGYAPIRLQDHGDPVSFRHIWVREI